MRPTGFIGGLITGSLRHRFVVLGLALLLAAYGVFRLVSADYDVFPDFAPPRASIQTEAPGLTAEQVEALVTRPIETRILGVPGVATVRSRSVQGVSDISVIFDASADLFRARQQLNESLAGLGSELPQGIAVPTLAPLTSSTGIVLIAGVTSNRLSAMELRTLADWTIRPRLLAVPGVAQVSIYGGDIKQYQVAVDPAKLARYGLSFAELAAAVQRTLGVRGAGFIDTANQRITIEASDPAEATRRLAGTVVVMGQGQRLTLADISSVEAAPAPAVGAALIDGRPGLQLLISDQYGANTVKVAQAVEAAIGDLNAELKPQGVVIRPDLFRPAGFIATALGNLQLALGVGGVLVIAVVFLFLWNIRMAVIALTAIPLALLAGTLVLELLGYSLNTMTLGGLGIAVGLLVDDAVIVVENVYRRLRLARDAGEDAAINDAIGAATFEVRSAVVYATIAIALIFVPVLAIQDVAGRLFGPLGLAYILATLASLVVALTVTPALCSLLIRPDRLPHDEPALTHRLKRSYTGLLGRVDRNLGLTAALVIGASIAVFSVVPRLGTAFIPELKEGHYVLQMQLAPGSSLAASEAVGRQVASAVLRAPHVRSVSQRTGRAQAGAEVAGGPEFSELDIDLEPTDAEGQEAAETAIRHALAGIPGPVFVLRTFLTDRLGDVISGDTAPIVVRLHGEDLDALDRAAAMVTEAVRAVPGTVDVVQASPTGAPKLVVKLRQDALVRWGFNPLDVLDQIQAAYQGQVVGQVYEGERVFNAALILSPSLRSSPESVSSLLLKSPDGAFVPAAQLADISEASGRYEVVHIAGQRVQTVTAGTTDANVGAVTARVAAKVNGLKLPAGVTAGIEGAAAEQAKSARTLLINSILAAVAMLLLLSLTVPRGRNLGLVFLNLPFAMVGGVLALWLTGGIASLGALVGFVTLFGITLRNAIMMVSHYDLLTREEGHAWNMATSIEGAADRLAPILMTTLATAFGLLPLAIGSGEPGREIEGPMAVVILGGLVSSAALNLLVLPGLALRFGRFGPEPSSSNKRVGEGT
ncbi:efflux RND transporter permease subunit [Sphingomonas sp. TX0543]|uniref:efflux RND transporter permease subunit n=1 Tax=Sphingomonas sp. TX0543 TaxID=3399682 RepID=UPI003AFA5ADB